MIQTDVICVPLNLDWIRPNDAQGAKGATASDMNVTADAWMVIENKLETSLKLEAGFY